MTLIFDEERTPEVAVIERLNEAANGALKYENFSDAMIEDVEISVSFVSKEEIQDLNKTYRDTDSVTDVLSFPQYDDLNDIIEGDIIELGDVVICEEKCKEQAEEFGHSFERELIYLFTHSVFHLLGYDHMTDEDKQEMREAEETVLTAMGLKREE